MSEPLTILIVEPEACEGCNFELFMARGPHPETVRYCDDCSVRLRPEIRRIIHDHIMAMKG